MENIENTLKNAENKLLELRAVKKELEAERALRNAPVNETKEVRSKVIADIQKAMQEKRSITLGGTGNVSIVRDLMKKATAKKEILSKFRYFYGPNAETVIPVWSSDIGRAVEVAEDGTFDSSSGTLATKSLNVKAFCKSIPVSNETLKLSAVNFESELDEIIADIFADTIAYQIFNAEGTGAFKNIYENAEDVPVAKKNISGLAKFALSIRDKMDNATIIMSPSVYADIEASDSNAKEKAWAKELIEKKTIEGVPVLLTSYAKEIIGGDLLNMAVAVAEEISIEPKKAIGSLVTTFDVSMYLAGTPVVDGNLFVMNDAA